MQQMHSMNKIQMQANSPAKMIKKQVMQLSNPNDCPLISGQTCGVGSKFAANLS
jgi:hypothetical protein